MIWFIELSSSMLFGLKKIFDICTPSFYFVPGYPNLEGDCVTLWFYFWVEEASIEMIPDGIF